MKRRLTADDGQTTPLVLGMTVIVLAIVMVMFAATVVTVQHRQLQSLADGAAASGAEAVAFALDSGPGFTLTDAEVRQAVDEHLAAVGATETVPGLSAVQARVAEDGTTVVVTLGGTAEVLPLPPAFDGILPAHVEISAEGSSRTSLQR
ncbi:pilus assembly protein TadG-related protein [Micrococcus luteus]